ncbi:DNA internalization-related competence protein ComEC/Rec2 [Marinicella sp. W31]|uniref:DNA internalization-related competence protein ComEC/Rec2 n=1 Tax=Marinicella sp. W31 TaxID=3023713 RepID=UPI0037564EEC
MAGVSHISWISSISFVWTCILLACCYVLRYKNRLITVSYLILGVGYAQIYCHFQLQEKLTQPLSEPLTITGTIIKLPDTDDRRARFLFTANDTPHKNILLHWYWNESNPVQNIKSGQEWQFQVALKPPHGLANEAGFDYARWLFRHGIDALGTVRSGKLLSTQTFSWNHIHHFREQVRDWVNEHFTQQPARGLVKALTIGDRSDIPHTQQQLLQTSGAAHLLAISGLHIGIAATLGYHLGWLVFYLFRPRSLLRPDIQSMTALLCALFYALLAGFSIPTLRALLMLSVVLLTLQRRRTIYSWDIYAMALFLVLIYDPLSVLDAGFWLSFAAVMVLLLAFRGRPKLPPWLSFVQAQWAILIGLLPLSVLLFGGIQGIAPIVNVLLIPLMAILLMPLLFLMLGLAGVFSTTPDILIQTIELCIEIFNRIMQHIGQWDWLSWSFPVQSVWAWLGLILFAIIMLIPAVIPKRWLAWIFVLPSIFTINRDIPENVAEITTFDVGQGLSVLIRTRHHSLLYDTGAASPSGFSMANAVIIPALKKANIQKLDKIILSHADNDHAGGYSELAKQFRIEQTLASFDGFEACFYGHTWVWDGVFFEILSPYNITPYLGNNSSCVLRISTSLHSVLVTGDIESPVEYRLQQRWQDQLNTSILLVPHHGSNTSSTDAFLDAVNPRLAVNSSAFANRFNHPTPSVKTRYQQRNIPFLDTQTYGMIKIRLAKTSHIHCFLESHQRLWRIAEARTQKSPQQCGLLSNVLNSD